MMPQRQGPRDLDNGRPAHPMRASIILVTAVALLIVLLAVTSSVS
jgi:hypothetical protein